MKTLSRYQRNAIMRAAAAAVAIPITVTPVLFSNRAALYSNTGVAPFSVLFHGCNTTDTETTNPFRNCAYVWNFGETTGPGVAAWGQGADPTQSRNWSYGPVGGHVYETPGTYIVTLQVTSAVTGNISAVTTTITVLDPAVVYAGTKTVCVSTSGNFTGAPSGCVQLTASNTNAIQPYLADGKRFLFRAGEIFHQAVNADVISFIGLNGCTVGRYGTGARPIISFDVGDGSGFSSAIGGGNDCRFMDLAIIGRTNLVTATIDNGSGSSGTVMTVTAVLGTGAALAVGDSVFPSAATGLSSTAKITAMGTGTGGVGTYTLNVSALVASTNFVTGNHGCRGYQSVGTGVAFNVETKGYCTVLRCDFQYTSSAMLLDGTANTIQDCSTSNQSGEPGVFPGAGNTGACAIFSVANGTQFQYIAGNSFDRSNTGEHTGRFQGSSYSLFEANYWKGANNTKTLLATRGMIGASVGMLNSNYVIRNNYFDLMGGLGISNVIEVQLHNDTFYEPTSDVIIDHNYFSQYDWNASFYAPNNINSIGQRVTVRNNVMNFSSQMSTGNNSSHRGVLLNGFGSGSGGTPCADDTLVKNNSARSSTTVRESLVVDANIQGAVIAYPTNTVIANNVLYAPSSSGNTSGAQAGWIYTSNNASGTKAVTTNNTIDAQVKTVDPLYSAPTTYAGFGLGVGSYALAAGMGLNYVPNAI